MSILEHKHVTEIDAAPARRVEIFTGAGRRRTWTVEEKASIVAESYEEGVRACQVARRHGLTPQQLFTWRRAARESLKAVDAEAPSAFVPAVVEATAVKATPAEPADAQAASVRPPIIELESKSPDERRDARQERSRPILDALEPWLREKLARIRQKTKLAEAIRYALSRWDGLMRFVDDGRIEINSNIVERAIRPIALKRKNALFAGSDGGGRELGDWRLAYRDLQAQRRRSAGLHHRRPHEDRRGPSREQARRTHAVGLRAAGRTQRRGLKTAVTTNPLRRYALARKARDPWVGGPRRLAMYLATVD